MPFYQANIEDFENLIDFIQKEKISDINQILYYILDTKDNDLNLGWLSILENDKLVDVVSAYISKQNSDYNIKLIKSYYDDIKNSIISV